MAELSVEAKVVCGAFWGIMGMTEVSFERPHIITKKARKGLDDLVTAGLLTVEKFNQHSAKLVWKPTGKMKTNKPKVSHEYIKANTFPITSE